MGYLNKILYKKLLKAKSMTNLPNFTVLFKHHWKFSKHTRSGSATIMLQFYRTSHVTQGRPTQCFQNYMGSEDTNPLSRLEGHHHEVEIGRELGGY